MKTVFSLLFISAGVLAFGQNTHQTTEKETSVKAKKEVKLKKEPKKIKVEAKKYNVRTLKPNHKEAQRKQEAPKKVYKKEEKLETK